jgi:hypothetical protein
VSFIPVGNYGRGSQATWHGWGPGIPDSLSGTGRSYTWAQFGGQKTSSRDPPFKKNHRQAENKGPCPLQPGAREPFPISESLTGIQSLPRLGGHGRPQAGQDQKDAWLARGKQAGKEVEEMKLGNSPQGKALGSEGAPVLVSQGPGLEMGVVGVRTAVLPRFSPAPGAQTFEGAQQTLMKRQLRSQPCARASEQALNWPEGRWRGCSDHLISEETEAQTRQVRSTKVPRQEVA